MEKETEVSVVLPCLNEEKAIGPCIGKIKEVFAKENIEGEVVVSDNGSVDRSREIADSMGARVVVEPQKGYGAAYLKGLKEARGKYIIMADADNTYDFNEIPDFIKALKNGADFVMGSRFKGKMKKDAMSWSHRYIGNPILSGLCRLFFHTELSDIHCGMRAFTKTAYDRMGLRTIGMEFATEMVVSALTNNFRIREVPISYSPREGESKLKPFYDAWRHMRFMLLYCPMWLYFVPGAAGFSIGFLMMLLLLKGPFLFLGRYWDIHVMVFGSILSILSYQVFNMGVFAHTFAIREGFIRYDRITLFVQRHFNLERGLLAGGAIFMAGLAILAFIVIEWFSKHLGALFRMRESIFAATLLVIGLQTMFSSFFISLLYLEKK